MATTVVICYNHLMRLIIISGRSGSGKSIALHALEDMGFYCIDNLPIELLPEAQKQFSGPNAKLAISIDSRNIPEDFSLLQASSNNYEIIYLDADENTLLRRFSETRRRHPLTNENTSLREAIRLEHNLLGPIANLADLTINTNNLTQHSLHNLIRDRVVHHDGDKLQILLQSFGFKYGLPSDPDFVFDVRCLANPYWQPDLRALTGQDKEVRDFLQQDPNSQHMLEDISGFLQRWIPQFASNNRSYMTIAVGCTGGHHRSVYLVEELAKINIPQSPAIQVRHRDLA